MLRPSAMAIMDDELFVLDTHSKRLQVFALDGTFLRFLQPVHAEGPERGEKGVQRAGESARLREIDR